MNHVRCFFFNTQKSKKENKKRDFLHKNPVLINQCAGLGLSAMGGEGEGLNTRRVKYVTLQVKLLVTLQVTKVTCNVTPHVTFVTSPSYSDTYVSSSHKKTKRERKWRFAQLWQHNPRQLHYNNLSKKAKKKN